MPLNLLILIILSDDALEKEHNYGVMTDVFLRKREKIFVAIDCRLKYEAVYNYLSTNIFMCVDCLLIMIKDCLRYLELTCNTG